MAQPLWCLLSLFLVLFIICNHSTTALHHPESDSEFSISQLPHDRLHRFAKRFPERHHRVEYQTINGPHQKRMKDEITFFPKKMRTETSSKRRFSPKEVDRRLREAADDHRMSAAAFSRRINAKKQQLQKERLKDQMKIRKMAHGSGLRKRTQKRWELGRIQLPIGESAELSGYITANLPVRSSLSFLVGLESHRISQRNRRKGNLCVVHASVLSESDVRPSVPTPKWLYGVIMVIKVYISGISGNKEVKKRQQRVVMILDSKAIKYDLVDIGEPGMEDEKDFMHQNANAKTAKHPLPPQIFNQDAYCGDYEEFDEANETDTLENFLKLNADELKEIKAQVERRVSTTLRQTPPMELPSSPQANGVAGSHEGSVEPKEASPAPPQDDASMRSAAGAEEEDRGESSAERDVEPLEKDPSPASEEEAEEEESQRDDAPDSDGAEKSGNQTDVGADVE
ncbi:unnamed protein product [Cyprideis torosa]|uniref:Uncharacterized protein n=1 Tax=Cyprideis torosa TaxID=163714 RepID=A0A7R8WJB2_9CRUS|nr:unnamed protein product [Cyprideis torosa]CAG0901804.1 unnamed protein product [Cyprideis torosa]